MKENNSIRNNEINEESATHMPETFNSPPVSAQEGDSYKTRKKIYPKEKKKIAEQLLTTLNDPTTLVLADWLKVRATIKAWYKVWCELRPGLLVVYKSQKTHKYGQWIGTVLLSVCQVIERPSRKDGICFKLFNPLEQNIWASRGPKGETFGAITMPLPLTSLMIRVGSKSAAARWIEAMQLSVQCSKRIIRNTRPHQNLEDVRTEDGFVSEEEEEEEELCLLQPFEKHSIKSDHELTDDPNSSAEHEFHSSDSDTGPVVSSFDRPVLKVRKHFAGNKLLPKLMEALVPQEFRECLMQHMQEKHCFKNESQTGAFGEENKSLMWAVLKQVRPGMDLSKVVLPTFILETRSFLDKLSDYYFHCDILSEAAIAPSPLDRFKLVIKWYLSGFYKKANGLKKPYNPVLGEFYRCYWATEHAATDTCSVGTPSTSSSSQNCPSRTYYLAEQVSHHPPMSAFYVINPQDGFQVSGVVLVKSKYYGNAVSAILEGKIRLRLLGLDEEYTITLPYAYCKGIVFGSLTFELGGKVEISCLQTGYSSELEFKLKPYFGGEMNGISGKIRCHGQTIATVEGHWDQSIFVIDKKNANRETLWQVNENTLKRRLKRFAVPIQDQEEMESERLWLKVTQAIENLDQNLATIEKTKLEDQQRTRAKQLSESNEKHKPRFFVLAESGEWIYNHERQLRSLVHNRLKQPKQKKLIKHKDPMKEQSLASVPNLDARLTQLSEQLQQISEQQIQLRFQIKDQEQISLNSTLNAFAFKDVLMTILFALITQFLIKYNLKN